MVLNYYPGCTLKNQAADLDRCARVSAEALGITLAELPQWQCCGGVYPMATDEIATRLSAVRALAEAGERTGTLVTVCSACHHVLKRTNEDLKRDETFRTRANGYLALPRPYEGQTRVLHFLELLRDTVGFERLKQAVTRPLTGRRIGAYYGCLLLRPGIPRIPGFWRTFSGPWGRSRFRLPCATSAAAGTSRWRTGLWQQPGRRQLWTMPRPRVRSCWLQLVRSASTI